MEKSTHVCPVIKLNKSRHENADTLSVVSVGDTGYKVVIKTSDWEGIDYGVYIPPDSIVDTERPEFRFLNDGKDSNKIRIKAKKLRGIISYGLLVPTPTGYVAAINENMAEYFGVEHYEPPFESASTGGDNAKPPRNYDYGKYDIDSIRGHKNAFYENELVAYSLKVHGCNSRYMFKDGEMWCGSRSFWKKDAPGSVWWKALRNTPGIELFCRAFPEYTLFGEVYGQIQKGFDYNKKGDAHFVSFDIRRPDGQYVDYAVWYEMCEKYYVPKVPILEVGPFSFEKMVAHSNGPDPLAIRNGSKQPHIREGVVVKPLFERFDDKIGRVILKLVGDDYLLGKN